MLRQQDAYVLLETARPTCSDHRTMLFLDPVAWLRCGWNDDPAQFLEAASDRLRQGFYLAGWFAYEFGYLLEPSLASCIMTRPLRKRAETLASLGVFRTPHIFDHRQQGFSGAGAWPEPAISKQTEPECRIDNIRLNVDEYDYLEAVRTIKEYIADGDTYQVNYTVKLRFDLEGTAEDLYQRLRRSQSVSYSACIKEGERRILSFSPELFFRKHQGTITVRPMKGTSVRGRTLDEDSEHAEFLRSDIKNRSENVMIVDLLRNDLGRLSSPGGVRVRSIFDVEKYETLLQMTSTIEGAIPPGLSLAAVFKALFPCGSVTGAPKIRTMEIIRELELEDRGVYTGAIGFFAPDGEAVFNVPIRTAVLNNGRGEMGIGSGIVWDSDPAAEWQECRLKARFLINPAPEFQLIETMRWQAAEGFWLLDLHLKRLENSARYFGFALDPDTIREKLQQRAAGFTGPRRLRLTLERDGACTLADVALPPQLPAAEPYPIRLSTIATDSRSPFLFHKTTERQLYDEERRHAVDDGCFEVLFRNENGELTEGAISNLFIRKSGRLLTPPVQCGLLNGILRQHLLESGEVVEAVLTEQDLAEAEAIYMGNSVRGLFRVTLRK